VSPILGIYASQISGHLFAPSGAYDSIATVTGSGSSITFTSIPSTYTHLQVRLVAPGSSDSDVWMRFNSDTGSNYSSHRIYGDGSGVAAGAATSSTKIDFGARSSGSSTIPAPAIIDVLDYANTSKYKTSRELFGWDNNGSGYIMFGSGLWMSTSAITSITLLPQVGTFQSGTHAALYGIRGN